MALQLIENIKGYPFTYWKITNISVDLESKLINVHLGLYKDRIFRLENPGEFVKKEMRTIKFADIDLSKNILSELYTAIKIERLSSTFDEEGNITGTYNNNKFTDALDVLD